MNKLSHEQVKEILSQVGPTLRDLSDENEELKEKLAYYNRKEKVEKIASKMQNKNLDPETSYEDKVQSLMSTDKDLNMIEEAIDWSGKQIKVASLVDERTGNSTSAHTTFFTEIMN